MKKTMIFIYAFALGISVLSCQNQSSNSTGNSSSSNITEQQAMNDTASNMRQSDMMTAMNSMMKSMHQMNMSGNADHDLAAMLKYHHQGAIDMAQIEVQSGTEEQLKKMAQQIIDKQKKEIEDLEPIIKQYKNGQKNYDPNNKNEGLGKELNKNMMSMMEMDHGNSPNMDHEFATMMKKHHQDGVEMANIILRSRNG